jgi:hypothetical protein
LNIARRAGIVPLRLSAGQPVRDDRVVDQIHLPLAVALNEGSRSLVVVDVG